MRLIAKYLKSNQGERRLFFRALRLVIFVRVALSILPFRVTQKLVNSRSQIAGPSRGLSPHDIRQVGWAIEAAARRVPEATCLTKGMAMQILLAQLGQTADLHLGVSRNPSGKFQAHAWVEINKRVVMGGSVEAFDQFVRLHKQSS